MRTYYVFLQEYELINGGAYIPNNFIWYPEYKLLPWQYYGQIIGTKALWNEFKDMTGCHHRINCAWVSSFAYEPNTVIKKEGALRGIVIDDAGHIRNFYELTKPYHHYYWKYHSKHHKGYHYHCFTNHNEKKQRLTPQESKELQCDLDFSLPDIKPDRKARGWDEEKFTATGGSWKDQSKKQRQYGNKCVKLSKWIFYQEEENSSAYAEL